MEDKALQKKQKKADRYVDEPERFKFKSLSIEMEDNHHISLQPDRSLTCTCGAGDCARVQHVMSLLAHLL